VTQVTVVIPTHNRPALLPLTLKSVLWQREVDLEVVVVDDASNTDLAPVIDKLEDPRVRLVRQDPAQGVSVARNRGAEEGSAPWLAFVDDDDLWSPEKLALQLAAADEAGTSWVYTGEVNVTLDLRVLGGAPPLPPHELADALHHANAVPGGGSGVLVDAGAFRDLGGFDTGYRHFADWDLWLRLSYTTSPAWVPRPLVGYRIHTMNRSLDTEGMVAELDLIEQRHNVEVDRVAFFRHVARVSLRGGRHREALSYYLRAGRRLQSHYLLRDFLPDVWRATSAPLRAHLPEGRARRMLEAPVSKTPNPAWLDEGRTWIRALGDT
jgi:glycosyltransferase involved in cell wall biosynthesis